MAFLKLLFQTDEVWKLFISEIGLFLDMVSHENKQNVWNKIFSFRENWMIDSILCLNSTIKLNIILSFFFIYLFSMKLNLDIISCLLGSSWGILFY